jgi:UPF0755 protein
MEIRFFKPALYFILALGLMAASITIYNAYALLKKPMIAAGESIVIVVKPNSTANSLIQTLYAKNLIHSKRLFLNLMKYEGLAQKLKAGTYQVKPGESARDLIHRIAAGDVLTLYFRIIEGSTIHLVTANLKNTPFLNYNEDDWLFITENHYNAEGLLLADTYKYDAGSDAKNLLLTANKKLLLYLEDSWQKRSPGLPYKTSYEMLVAASILEKETAIPSEREVISGVIVNRLLKYMPLQMDPTVIYALGENYSGKLSHNDLSFDSHYNTYRYRGLPPTPIAMVGKDAINAAAHPQKSNFLYFVAKGDGSHEFSETYEQQKKAIARYLSKGSK